MKLYRFEINGETIDVLATYYKAALYHALDKMYWRNKNISSLPSTLQITYKKLSRAQLAASPVWAEYKERKRNSVEQPNCFRKELAVGDYAMTPTGYGRIAEIEGDQMRVTIVGDENQIGDLLGIPSDNEDGCEIVGRLAQRDGDFYIDLLTGKELAVGARVFNISRTARVQNQWVNGQSRFFGIENEPNAELAALGL